LLTRKVERRWLEMGREELPLLGELMDIGVGGIAMVR
jgi:hypothetical protein